MIPNIRMKKTTLLPVLILLLSVVTSLKSLAQEDIGNEYRITLFPSHRVTERIGGFGYLGYVWNPVKEYRTYYLGWPCATYTPKKWVQIWGGVLSELILIMKPKQTCLSYAPSPVRSFSSQQYQLEHL